MKRNKVRLIFLLAFTALTNGYAKGFVKGLIYKGNLKHICVPGLNCYSCPGAFGSCPVGSLQATLSSPQYKISLYVFGLLGLFGTILGRAVCGFMCPFGLIQELIYKIPFPRKIKKIPGHNVLRYLRYAILLIFVILLPMLVTGKFGGGEPWFCEYICPSGILMGSIPLLISNEALREMIGVKFFVKLGILIFIILTAVINYRPFCKYLCPLGAFYGLFNKIALIRYKIDDEKCTKCGACNEVCDMNVNVLKNVNSTECIRCGKCIDRCANGAITVSFEELRRNLKKHEKTENDT